VEEAIMVAQEAVWQAVDCMGNLEAAGALFSAQVLI
jgi:hypothetical protein